ncbi:MAG: hypothetical protein LBT06_10235 [Hungatella sp.]|nr:hypothetical protein [Hungatella sp.]
MSTNYELIVKNNSTLAGDICVYTTCPDAKQVRLNLKSLAWFKKAANPGTSVDFQWALDYGFAWSQTGELVEGVRFVASQIQPADPSDENKNVAFFNKENDAYIFGDVKRAKPSAWGTLGITASGNIPNKDASIGISIGGKAALVTSATPNYEFTFIPKVKYWVAFGSFKEGEVLDLNAMTSEVFEVDYPFDQFSRTVVLGMDNKWRLESTIR